MLHGPKESLGSVTHRNEWWLPTKGWLLDKITLRDSAGDAWVSPIGFWYIAHLGCVHMITSPSGAASSHI